MSNRDAPPIAPRQPRTNDLHLVIEYRRPQELKRDPKNPRRHGREQKRLLAISLQAHGFVIPVTIDLNDRIIGGHARVEVALEQGWTEIPTIRLEHLSAQQVKALQLAENRLAEIATWDDDLVAEALQELAGARLEFDLEASGFTMGEIDFRIEQFMAEDDPEAADMMPPPGPAVSRTGDLWVLGSHRVLCGDALDGAAYRVLMGEKRASMVFIDPPYNVPIEGHASGLGGIRHRNFQEASGEMNKPEFTAFLRDACAQLVRNSVDGSIHFICMDWRHLDEILEAGRASYTELKNVCVWIKSNAGMGSFYRSQHELVFVFKQGKGRHRNNIQLGQYGRHRTNVWPYPNISAFGRGGDEGNLLAVHPTVKPVALVADAIKDCSARGDIVLDSFLGSGTTLIAAERSGRCCYGMELDPLYVDTAVRRWQIYSGEIARHAVTGGSFEEIAAERANG